MCILLDDLAVTSVILAESHSLACVALISIFHLLKRTPSGLQPPHFPYNTSEKGSYKGKSYMRDTQLPFTPNQPIVGYNKYHLTLYPESGPHFAHPIGADYISALGL